MRITRTDLSAAVIAMTLIFGAIACKGTGSVEGDMKLVAVEVGFRATWDEREVTVAESPARVDIRFLDANGSPVGAGATGVAPGDIAPLPAGATHVEFVGPSSETSCTGCSGGGSGGGGTGNDGSGGNMAGDPESDTFAASMEPTGSSSSSGQRTAAHQPATPRPIVEKWLVLHSLGADLDGSTVLSNIDAAFHVRMPDGATLQDVHNQVAGILFSGPGAPVPPNVDVDMYVKVEPQVFGGRMIIADQTQAFHSLTLMWNRAFYADLGSNSLSYSAPNGWEVVEVFIPSTEFVLTAGDGSANSMRLTWQTADDVTPSVLDAALAYW